MTSDSSHGVSRPPSPTRDADDDQIETDEPFRGPDHHPGDEGARIVSLVLMGVTVVGAVAMIGFNWTAG